MILQEVYFNLRFILSYRDVEEIMKMRSIQVEYTTIQPWVYKFTLFIDLQMKKRKLIVGRATVWMKHKLK